MGDLSQRAREWLDAPSPSHVKNEAEWREWAGNSLTSLLESVRREGKAEGRAEALEEASELADEWARPSVLSLRAGELTAQEKRTAIAVLHGLAAKFRHLAAQKKEIGT